VLEKLKVEKIKVERKRQREVWKVRWIPIYFTAGTWQIAAMSKK
jgi:hypothetical protein